MDTDARERRSTSAAEARLRSEANVKEFSLTPRYDPTLDVASPADNLFEANAPVRDPKSSYFGYAIPAYESTGVDVVSGPILRQATTRACKSG